MFDIGRAASLHDRFRLGYFSLPSITHREPSSGGGGCSGGLAAGPPSGDDRTRHEFPRPLPLAGATRQKPIRDLQARLDEAVGAAYGLGKTPTDDEILGYLLTLNQQVAAREARGEAVIPPGLPPGIAAPKTFVTTDCVRFLG